LSLATVSAQVQVTGSICTTSGGQSGSWNGTLCIGNGAIPSGGGQQVNSQNQVDLGVVASLIKQVKALVDLVIPLLGSLALAWFMWNLIRYFLVEAPDDKKTYLTRMWMGLGALFVMVSVWGIIRFAQNTTGINSSSGPQDFGSLVPR
jgi:hypothetical protein